MSSGSYPFTASELVLLNGDQFSKSARLGGFELLQGGAKVSADQLGLNAIAAAFLANEQMGAIRLEIRPQKKLFGLMTATPIFVELTSGDNQWPAGTLEAAILDILRQRQATGKPTEVHQVIYDWLGEDSSAPWSDVLTNVQRGLAGRGLLEMTQEKKMKIFTTTRFELPHSTATLAQQYPPSPAQQLLSQAQQSRKDIWDKLSGQIRQAISNRTERDSGSDGPDFD